jgi:hypothetical protein
VVRLLLVVLAEAGVLAAQGLQFRADHAPRW